MKRRHGTTRPTHHRRTDLAFAAVAALGLAGFAFLIILMQGLGHDLRAANEARDQLATQVEQLGESPVAGPPGSRGEPGHGVDGPPGPRGEPGATGSPGADGSPGPSGPPGPSGSPGVTGSPGPSGAAVTGPAGPPGPQGEQGPAGPQGPPGTDGRNGVDGQPCPDGYTLQPPPSDPDALICRRTAAPPPTQEPAPTSPVALDPFRRQY
ncbi:collagen-like protein [Streptomyces sp. NPDC059949]|uniref:collagen-like protein n=1 Tax=Streptomyces sp. NPDC059949 TaxID=3347013 RepID=UPI003652EAF0